VRSFFSQNGVLRYIIPLANQHPGLLTSLAYISCSNLDAVKGQEEGASSLIVKGKAVRSINDELANSENATNTTNMLAVACVASAVNV
jgi:hypothetical protein